MSIDMQRVRSAQLAFHDYYFYQHSLYGNANDDFCWAAIRRIEQTVLILRKIDSQLELRHTASDNWLSEIEIYVEAFYWFAFSAGRAAAFSYRRYEKRRDQ